MVELLIRTQDKKADTPTKALEVQRMHRGDVVLWRPDGWPWSAREKASPAWRILRINITPSEADALVSPELDVLSIKLHVWKRIRKLDLDNVLISPGKFKTFLDDDSRSTPVFTFTGDVTLLGTITETKPNADTVVS